MEIVNFLKNLVGQNRTDAVLQQLAEELKGKDNNLYNEVALLHESKSAGT